MRIRNRLIFTLLMPVTIFLFAVGWLLQCFGERTCTQPQQIKQAPLQTNGIQIHIATAEEREEYND
jgi:hypothetical protein